MFRTLNRSNAPELFSECDSPSLQAMLPLAANIAKNNALTAADLKALCEFRTSSGMSALHVACFHAATELNRLLLKETNKTWLQEINQHSISPLYYAIHGELRATPAGDKDAARIQEEKLRIPTIDLLLENAFFQEHINQATKSAGNTALHIAAEKGYALIAGILLAAGADAKAMNKAANLPLHSAIARHSNITAQNLMLAAMLADAAEENVNDTNKVGDSALKIALASTRYDIVSTLLMHHASAAIPTLIGSESFLKDHIDESINMFQTMLQKNNGPKEIACIADTLEVSSSNTRKAFFAQLIRSYLAAVKQSTALKNSDLNAQEALLKQTLLGLVINAVPAGKNHLYQDEFVESFFQIANDKKTGIEDRELLLQLATQYDAINIGLSVLQDKIPISHYQKKINDALAVLNKEKSLRFPLHDAITKGEDLIPLIQHIPAEDRLGFINKKRDTDRHTALSLAVSLGQWQNVATLLQEGADPALPKKSEENRDQNILHYLIQDTMTHKIETPLLMELLTQLNGPLLPRLLRAESKAEGSPIDYAVKTNNAEVVNTMMKTSGEFNAFLQTSIAVGSPQMFVEIANHLPTGKTIDSYLSEEGLTLLQSAVIADKTEHLIKLIEWGADVNRETPSGETALHLAAKASLYDGIKTLLDHGANALAVNRAGKTFLELLVEQSPDITPALNQLKAQHLYSTDEKQSEPRLLTHLLLHYSKKSSLPEAKNFQVNLSALASLDLEKFYKEFKHVSNQLRAASNSGKLTSEAKLALLIQHRQLCQLVQNIKPAFETFRKVKYHGLFSKSGLADKLAAEQKELTQKIETLDRMIHKLENKGPSHKKFH